MYLRVGWVYRDLSARGLDGDSGGSEGITDVDNSLRNWFESFHHWKHERETLGKILTESGSLEGTQGGETLDKIAEMETRIRELMNTFAETVNVETTHEGVAASAKPFGGKPSLFNFLRDIKGQWPDIPLNEKEALESSIERYKRALESGKEISAGSQQVQVCYLIGELSRRIGNYEEARDYFNGALKAGQVFIQKYRNDTSRTALARRILELAMEQSQLCREEAKAVESAA